MKNPTKQIYIGAPLEGYEALFLRRLYDDLGDREALILANFFIPKQVDFLVITRDGVTLLELKNLIGPVFGTENGDWLHQNAAGERVPYDGNPFKQTLDQKYMLSDAMHKFQRKTDGVPNPVGKKFAYDFLAFVSIYPAMDPRSKVTVSDYKVSVAGYDIIRGKLGTLRTDCAWQFEDWREFARSHNLRPVTLDEATDESVSRALHAQERYNACIRGSIGDRLPPLLDASADDYGIRLVARLQERHNWTLIGASGSTKSFHLEHLTTALVDSEDEMPLLVRAGHFEHGPFAAFLQREVAPYFAGDPAELIASARRSGKRPVLIIDGVNECSERARRDLLEGAQAFVLRYEGRVVLSAQHDITLPNELQGQRITIPSPDTKAKRAIYAYHADIVASPELDALCTGFTNAYDLVIAGRCHRAGAAPGSSAQLYDRYVRETLSGNTITGAAFLRAFADEMRSDLTFCFPRDRFESLAEAFARDEGVPLSVLDAVGRSGLVVFGADTIAFEHELLFSYFLAEVLRRQAGDVTALAEELKRPRNRNLFAFVLPRLTDQSEIATVLRASEDVTLLSRVISGGCGDLARDVLLGECYEVLERAFADLGTLNARCETQQVEGGRGRLVDVTFTGQRSLTARDRILLAVIGRSLDNPALQQRFFRLLDATESTVRQVTGEAAAAARFKPRAVWGTVLHNTFVLSWPQATLPCGVIIAALREHTHHGLIARVNPSFLAALRERTAREAPSDIAALCLLEMYPGEDGRISDDLQLVKYAWNSGHYSLRTQAMYFIQRLNALIHERHANLLPAVRDMLRSFETEHIFESTALVDALAAYGALDGLPTEADALVEMQNIIRGGDPFTDANADALAKLSGLTPAEARCSAAYGAVASIFEEPLGEAYYGAYSTLSEDERCTLLVLAAMRDERGAHATWILTELIQLRREDALPAFKRYASQIPGMKQRVYSAQEDVASYFLGLQGCAQWLELPPQMPEAISPQERGWKTIGQIVFWHFRFGQSALERTATLWRTFPDVAIAGGVLFDAVTANVMIYDDAFKLDFVNIWPTELRDFAEGCLTLNHDTPTLSPCRAEEVRAFFIHVLSTIGGDTSLAVLRQLADDSVCGERAVKAIASIQRRLAAIPT